MKSYKLIAIERRGDLLLGLILKQENEKIEVYLETGEKVKITSNKIIYTFHCSLEGDNEKTMRLALKTARENFQTQKIDLPTLWECADTDEDYLFQDLAQAYFQECTDMNLGALWIAFSQEQPYFVYRGGYFVKNPPALVQTNLRRSQVEKENRSFEDSLVAWLEEQKSDFNPESEPAKKIIEALKKYALEGEEKASAEAKRIANILFLSPDEMIQLLEHKGILPRDINETLYRIGLTWKFPNELLNEVQTILNTTPNFSNRRRIPDCWNVAIDDSETVEVDDAISYSRQGKYHIIGVHIADVAVTIPKNSELDQFASERFSTIYFPEEKLFLFPNNLVQERLTLAAGIARPTISGFFYFDSDGCLVKSEFEQTLFELKQRATYEQTIASNPLAQGPEFIALQVIATQLREKRRSLGAVITEMPDIKIKVEENEISLQTILPMPGHLVVSEFMILFNTELANYLAQHQCSSIFRTQSTPSVAIQSFTPSDPLYPLKIRWSLPPATLSLEPSPHYTLAAKAYVQASSPMRRYSDLIIQRQLIAILENQATPYTQQQLLAIKAMMERTEKLVRNAEHNRYLFWLYKYLKNNKGKEYQAYISRILDMDKTVVFIPELMQEFPFKVNTANPQLGQSCRLRVQNATPRRRRAYFEEIF